MNDLMNQIQNHFQSEVTYSTLGDFIERVDFSMLDYQEDLPIVSDPGEYGRKILCMEPCECVLLHWPPECESAIHFHQGFYGYVVVLEGWCKDVGYEFESGFLSEIKSVQCFQGSIIPEQDGIIHKLCNPSKNQTLVTLHFYYPALESLKGMKIFDLINKKIAVLSENAPSASFNGPQENFDDIIENAFEYKAKGKSHKMIIVSPKPEPDRINSMLMDYYNEQASFYDLFDLNHPTRRPYTESLNQLIAKDLSNYNSIGNLLSIACGTGRRSKEISVISGHDFEITGIDLSEEMCKEARSRGIDAIAGHWLEVDLPPERKFDAAIFLYAFGHIPNENLRLETLVKIRKHLKKGAPFYFDVFNLNDQNEWGPAALKSYEKYNLAELGYDRGDIFYQKADGHATAYLHYFSEVEITGLLEKAGFEIEWIRYVGYVKNSGELLDNPNEGFFFIKSTIK